jgi:hypothetical protein
MTILLSAYNAQREPGIVKRLKKPQDNGITWQGSNLMISAPHVMFRSKKVREGFGRKMTQGRVDKIQNGPASDHPDPIDPKKNYIIIKIEQHSQSGVKKDQIELYMDRKRINCWNIKHNGLMLIHPVGKKLLRMGIYRVMAWISANTFPNIRRLY